MYKTEGLRGQELLPAHTASLCKLKSGSLFLEMDATLYQGSWQRLDWTLAHQPHGQAPVSSAQPVQPHTAALADDQPTLFLIIHLTKRLS